MNTAIELFILFVMAILSYRAVEARACQKNTSTTYTVVMCSVVLKLAVEDRGPRPRHTFPALNQDDLQSSRRKRHAEQEE